MNRLTNLFKLQSFYDKINVLQREGRKQKIEYSQIEAETKKKYLEWKLQQKAVNALKNKINEKELTLKSIEDKIKQYEKTLYSDTAPKSSKALTELQQKIENMRAKADSYEGEIVELMSELENVEAEFTNIDEQFRRTKLDYQKAKAYHQAKSSDVQGDIVSLNKQIEIIKKQIPSELLQEFDLAFSRGQQTAVVYVLNGTCSGCHTSLSQRIQDAVRQKPNEIHYCENCNRILVKVDD